MPKTVRVHIADNSAVVSAQFLGAWRRAEAGELLEDSVEIHLSLASWEAMVRTLSPKRLVLLRHVHGTGNSD